MAFQSWKLKKGQKSDFQRPKKGIKAGDSQKPMECYDILLFRDLSFGTTLVALGVELQKIRRGRFLLWTLPLYKEAHRAKTIVNTAAASSHRDRPSQQGIFEEVDLKRLN